MTLLLRITSLVSIASFLAGPALAHPADTYHQGYGHGRPAYRSLTLAFDRLDARMNGDELVVDYAISPESWRAAGRAGVCPMLAVEAGRHRLSARLERSEGHLVFRAGHRIHDEIRISAGGSNGRVFFESLSLGRRSGRFLVLDVGRGRRPGPPPRWSWQPAVIHACETAFEGRANEAECRATADGFASDPVPMILACESTMEGDAAELACLRTAARGFGDTSRQLYACEAALEGDANELACYATALRVRFDPVPVIQACEAAFEGDANELACLDATARFAWSPVPVIRACEARNHGDSAQLACLERS